MEKNEPTQSKYDAALAKYNTHLDDAEIAAQAARIMDIGIPPISPGAAFLSGEVYPELHDLYVKGRIVDK